MLVLSRRPTEKIAFPTLGISVEIVRVDGRTVRVGIDAPRSVPVIRGELPGAEKQPAQAVVPEKQPPRLDHHLRGCLNTATIALCLAQKQIEVGATEAAQQTLEEALGMIASLEEEMSAAAKPAGPGVPRHPTALLVEDNVNECALLVSYLRLSSFEVDAVNDGQAALDYLATRGRPDLILLDMRLPTKSGPEILESIRSNPFHRDLKGAAMIIATEATNTILTKTPLGDVAGRLGVDARLATQLLAGRTRAW